MSLPPGVQEKKLSPQATVRIGYKDGTVEIDFKMSFLPAVTIRLDKKEVVLAHRILTEAIAIAHARSFGVKT